MIAGELVERIRDVGLTLYACDRFHQKMGRLQLQKLVYLLDSLVLAVRVSSVRKGHKTYLHGPYDGKVQKAVDVLSFRGLAEVDDIVFNDDGSVSSSYRISHSGKLWVEQMIGTSRSIQERSLVAEALVDALARRQAFSQLKRLVYSEPTYALAKVQGYEVPLELDSLETNLSAQVLALLERSLSSTEPAPLRFVADVFLEFLKRRQAAIGVAEHEG